MEKLQTHDVQSQTNTDCWIAITNRSRRPGLVFAVGTTQIRIKPNQSFTILILTSNHQSEANESYQMGSDWRRSMGNVRSFVGNSMGGLRGGQNLASWLVAGTIAYYLWVKPAQDLKKEQQVPISTLMVSEKKKESLISLSSMVWFRRGHFSRWLMRMNTSRRGNQSLILRSILQKKTKNQSIICVP